LLIDAPKIVKVGFPALWIRDGNGNMLLLDAPVAADPIDEYLQPKPPKQKRSKITNLTNKRSTDTSTIDSNQDLNRTDQSQEDYGSSKDRTNRRSSTNIRKGISRHGTITEYDSYNTRKGILGVVADSDQNRPKIDVLLKEVGIGVKISSETNLAADKNGADEFYERKQEENAKKVVEIPIVDTPEMSVASRPSRI
jgi:hypothetical protein